jgi:hypothetical protein
MDLAVDRVEDARTIRQRLRIPAAQWRQFAAGRLAVGPDTAEQAYRALQDFWDWLATEHADARPAVPLDDPHSQPVAPSAAWLSARYRDWQSRP